MLGEVDVDAKILEHGGTAETGAGALLIPRSVRHGLALGLASLYPQHRELLRLGSFLN